METLWVQSQTQPMVAQGTFDDGDSKNVKVENFGRAIGAVQSK